MKKFLLVTIIMVVVVSCNTPKQIAKTDTVYLNKIEYVNQIVHDSIFNDKIHFVEIKGDTVFIKDSIYKYIFKYKTDTCYFTDTCYKENTTTLEIEKKLSAMQRLSIWGFWILVAGGIAFILYRLRKRI